MSIRLFPCLFVAAGKATQRNFVDGGQDILRLLNPRIVDAFSDEYNLFLEQKS